MKLKKELLKWKTYKLKLKLIVESAEKAASAEVQKQQALAQTTVQIEQAKSQFEIQRMEQEAEIKRGLMAEEFSYQMKLAEMQAQVILKKKLK